MHINRLKYHYTTTTVYDLINKNNYTNNFKIPNITNINITLTCFDINKTLILKLLITSILLSNNFGKVIFSNKNSLKKKKIVGCKTIINGNQIYFFLERLIIYIFPNIKNFNGLTFTNSLNFNFFNFKVKNLLNLFEFKNEFFLFKTVVNILINIQLKNKNKSENELLFSSFNFPVKVNITQLARV